MNQSEFTQLMKTLKDASHQMNPRPEWMNQTRTSLLRHIELTSEQPARRYVTLAHVWSALSLLMPQRTVYAVVRPAVIFVLCFVVGTGGWIATVSASLRSLPGDTLYSVKLATEQTQAAVVDVLQGHAAATELRVSFASRRAQEVHKVLSARSDDKKKERVDAAVQQLKSEVTQVREALQQVRTDASPDEALAAAQTVSRAADEIKLALVVSGVHTTTAAQAQETVSAIDQLKSEAGKVQQEAANASSTPAVTAGASATTTTIVIAPTSTTPVATTTVLIILTPTSTPKRAAPPPKQEPVPVRERPLELAPDVTDEKTEITIEAWD